jgi:hypothetical protein
MIFTGPLAIRHACAVGTLVLGITVSVVEPAEASLLIDGTLADKTEFLAYLNLFGGGLGGMPAPFSYSTNDKGDGPSAVGVDAKGVGSHFGSRMAAAVATLADPSPHLTVHVGQHLPRVLLGSFRYDPGPPPASNKAGHQSIDLDDLAAFAPFSRVDHLMGATDIILHEVFEGLIGLGGGPFDPAHTGGIQEENSNRAAEAIRGVRKEEADDTRVNSLLTRLSKIQDQSGLAFRLEGDARAGEVLFIHRKTGEYLGFIAWDILHPTGDPALTREGWLELRGRIIGSPPDADLRVSDVQPGIFSLGGRFGIDSVTAFDVTVDGVSFFGVPGPSAAALVALGAGVLAMGLARAGSFPGGRPP